MDKLPQGLTIQRAGDYIERVESKSAFVQLIGSGSGTEIMEQVVHAHQEFALAPDPNWRGTEFIYVLTGCLQMESQHSESATLLGPGDLVLASDLSSPSAFTATQTTRFLYITSSPLFHTMSAEINELLRLAIDIEKKDGYTSDHCDRIQVYASKVGRVLSLDAQRLHHLMYGALLHDVGKVRIPPEILGKAGPLTPDEWRIMKQHPTLGRAIVEEAKMPDIHAAAPIIEQHHERIDGSGYPKGLHGHNVMVEAQIVAIVDTFDAMTTDRPYRNGRPRADALREIERLAGTWFDRDVTRAFLHAVSDEVDHDTADHE